MTNALIIANGYLNRPILIDLYNKYDVVLFLDGAINKYDINVVKNIHNYKILGDLDSAYHDILSQYPIENIVEKTSQDITDFEFSLEYLLNNYYNINLEVLNWYDTSEIDHVMSNFITCIKHSKNMNIKLVNDKSCICVLNSQQRKRIQLSCKIGDVVSVISYSEVIGLKYKGLEYSIKSPTLPIFWNGIRNVAVNNNVEIEIDSGVIAIFHNQINI
jgi:thiamine pyrophosphokinase